MSAHNRSILHPSPGCPVEKSQRDATRFVCHNGHPLAIVERPLSLGEQPWPQIKPNPAQGAVQVLSQPPPPQGSTGVNLNVVPAHGVGTATWQTLVAHLAFWSAAFSLSTAA